MVGRDKELQRLKEVWETAVATPQTTLITITGEAGVGKSRLLYEFEQWIDLQPEVVTLFKGRSAEQTRGTPYFLLRDMFSARFDIRESDPIVEVRQKFETAIAEVFADEAEMKAHFLGQWLGFDFSHSPHVATIGEDAEQLKNRGLLYLSQFLKVMAGERPLLLFLEDIHWADAPSLDAILDVLRREPELPLLMVGLTRPSLFERRPEWRELGQKDKVEIEGLTFKEPAYHLTDLIPLTTTDDRELLAEILQKVAEIPEQLFELVAGRAEGNPFYMEELVKMLIDDGVIVPSEEVWQVNLTQLNESRIPATLTGVLQARLDKLATDERLTLQRASVVGRVFWDLAVQKLSDDPDQVQLTPLKQRELIYQQNETAFVNTQQFLFKHDLLRDVTYQTVLKKARQLYHGKVAEWLVEVAEANGRLDEYAVLIGENYQLANKLDNAAKWYGRAGQNAAARYAHTEALYNLNLALNLTPINDYDARYPLLLTREKTYDIQGNREAQHIDLEDLTVLGKHLGATEKATIASRRANYARTVDDYATVVTEVQGIIKLAQTAKTNTNRLLAKAHWLWGYALSRQGQYSSAKGQFETSYQLAIDADDRQVVADCLSSLSSVFAEQYNYQQARIYEEQALTIRREIADRYGESISLNSLGDTAMKQGNNVRAQAYFEQSLTICYEISNRFGEGVLLYNLGYAMMNQNKYSVAERYFEQALIVCRDINFQLGEGLILKELGRIALAQADILLAETYYHQATAIHQKLSLIHFSVEIWAGLAQVRLIQGDKEDTFHYIQKILNFLRENPRLDGVENPMSTFHMTWQALSTLNKMIDANEVLSLAAQVMQDYLDNNSDPAMQEMYLRQPHHQVLWAAWLAKEKQTSSMSRK